MECLEIAIRNKVAGIDLNVLSRVNKLTLETSNSYP